MKERARRPRHGAGKGPFVIELMRMIACSWDCALGIASESTWIGIMSNCIRRRQPRPGIPKLRRESPEPGWSLACSDDSGARPCATRSSWCHGGHLGLSSEADCRRLKSWHRTPKAASMQKLLAAQVAALPLSILVSTTRATRWLLIAAGAWARTGPARAARCCPTRPAWDGVLSRRRGGGATVIDDDAHHPTEVVMRMGCVWMRHPSRGSGRFSCIRTAV